MVLDGEDKENRASYTSDMFAMVGTLFLFLYWPSFKYVPCPPSLPPSLPSSLLLSLPRPRASFSTGLLSSTFIYYLLLLSSLPPSLPPSVAASSTQRPTNKNVIW